MGVPGRDVMTDHRLSQDINGRRGCTCGSGTYWTGNGPTDRQALWFCGATNQAVGTDRPCNTPASHAASSTRRRKVVEISGVWQARCPVAGCGWTHIAVTLADANAAASSHTCVQPAKN